MIEKIEVTVGKIKDKVTKGTTLEELARNYQDGFKYRIILGKVNGQIRELSYHLIDDAEVEFFDLTSSEGNRIYLNGLKFILIYSIKSLYGKKADVSIEHSLDKGVYCETNFKLTPARLKDVFNKMKETIELNIPIKKELVDRLETIEYYNEIGDYEKSKVLRYNINTYVTLYRLGNLYDYFYSQMPTETSMIEKFELTYVEDNGFVLRFPTIYSPDKITPYVHHPNMFGVFNECREWAKIMKITTSNDLNELVSQYRVGDLIKIDETLQSNRLLGVAEKINDKKRRIKIVLIAGPSSSGKTTTSKKLCMYLESFGLHPKVLSMDDFFVERKDNPKDEDGKYDYECLEALDLKLFDKTIGNLLEGKETKVPTYDFIVGSKSFGNTLKLDEKDILVIEGIHALDEKILTNIPKDKKFKIYISPLTELNIDTHNRISTTDCRLLRRIVRDARTRGRSVEDSIKTWPSVRKGEELYIFPCQDEADVTINTALIYELGVLRTYVEPLLYDVPTDSPVYEEAKRLLKFIRLFLPIPSDAVPQDSILREFIGGSYFYNK